MMDGIIFPSTEKDTEKKIIVKNWFINQIIFYEKDHISYFGYTV